MTIPYHSTKEIRDSKLSLEELFKRSINALAYPNGNYTNREIKYLQESGYKCALTTEPGFNDLHTDPFKMKRLAMKDHSNIYEIIVRVSGLWGGVKKVKNRLLSNNID